jgi:hypothetical protein
LCSFIHGKLRYIPLIQVNTALIGFDQSHYHIKGGGFACTIWPEQAYDFALFNRNGNMVYNSSTGISLYQFIGSDY